MQIFVQCNHPFVYVLSGKETVGNLKKRFGEDATFSCSGRPLEDDMLLSQHVPEHGTVVVHMGLLGGKVHGSLARAGKVKGQTPQVEKAEKVKKLTGRAKKRSQFNRRFVNVVHGFGVKKGPNSQAQDK